MTKGPAKSSGRLVPITREVLRAFYASHPLESLPFEFTALAGRVELASAQLLESLPGSTAPSVFGQETPTRIDDCFWRNREFCEEVAQNLGKVSKLLQPESSSRQVCSSSSQEALHAERFLFGVQERNTQTAMKQVKQFLPTDFRGMIMESARQQKEAKFKRAIAELERKGRSVRSKYELYLEQQWERRESLAALGASSGVYKFLVK